MAFADTLFGSIQLAMLLKIVLAAVAGALVGFEREIHGRPAGLRTHLLVAVGACLMMIISESFWLKYGEFGADSVLRLDPARVAAQIVTGIGFLGAGVILKEGISVRGLTTAACLWLVAGLGMAFGMGLFIPGGIATAVALVSLIYLKKLEPALKKDRYLHMTVVADGARDIYPELEALFTQCRLRVTDLGGETDLAGQEVRYDFVLTRHKKRVGRELSTAIAGLEGVKKIRFH